MKVVNNFKINDNFPPIPKKSGFFRKSQTKNSMKDASRALHAQTKLSMKKHKAMAALMLVFSLGTMAQQISETKYGMRIDATGSNPTTELTVYAPNIIRVTKYVDGLAEMPDKRSYSVIMQGEKCLERHRQYTQNVMCHGYGR